MNIQQAEDFVLTIITDYSGCESARVVPTAELDDDLGLDDLDIIEILMELEDRFNLDITDEEAKAWVTVDDVLKYVKAKLEVAQ